MGSGQSLANVSSDQGSLVVSGGTDGSYFKERDGAAGTRFRAFTSALDGDLMAVLLAHQLEDVAEDLHNFGIVSLGLMFKMRDEDLLAVLPADANAVRVLKSIIDAAKTLSREEEVKRKEAEAAAQVEEDLFLQCIARLHRGEQLDAQIILAGMMRFSSAASQEAGCMALRKLAATAETKDEIAHQGAIHVIFNALCTHQLNARVQEQGFGALMHLADNTPISLSGAGGIHVVLTGMKAHQHHPGVQANACGALCNLCIYDTSNKAVVVNGGGVTAIVNALRAHPGSRSVQGFGYRALCCLGLSDAGVQAHVRDCGVAVLAAHALASPNASSACRHWAQLLLDKLA